METLRRETVKTRKEHVCFACLRKFPVGTMMGMATHVDNDEIYNLYMCKTCEKLIKEFEDAFIEPRTSIFWRGCVKEDLAHYEDLDTPEELLDYYRDLRHE